MKKKISLIFGASGQDGSLMANLLINKGYKVLAISRSGGKKNLNRLKIANDIKVIKLDIYNKLKVEKLIKNSKSSENYYFAGQSSLPLSFVKEIETFKSHNLPLYNILFSVTKLKKKIKIFNACSGLIYNHKEKIINESSELNPHSPYGFSKLVSFKSAAVLNSFRKVLPLVRGWSVAQSSFPSPPVMVLSNALFNTAADLTCLVCAILLANALV